MKADIMTHMIAGYPELEGSLSIIQSLVDAGAAALEIQFPFSDPTADGPAIQGACNEALRGGFRVSQGFDLVKKARQLAPETKIFIMSYASIVVQKGVQEFVRLAAEAGADGLIIPDLAPGADEGLYEAGKKAGLAVVPVVVPSMGKERMQEVLSWKAPYIYSALRVGITGTHTELSQEILDFLEILRSGGSKIMAGFGIDSRSQVEALQGRVDYLVVGSAIVRKTQENLQSDYPGAVQEYVRTLVHGK